MSALYTWDSHILYWDCPGVTIRGMNKSGWSDQRMMPICAEFETWTSCKRKTDSTKMRNMKNVIDSQGRLW